MANRKIKIFGYNHDAGSNCTVLWDGAEVATGVLSSAVTADNEPQNGGTPIELFSFEYNNADDSKETEHALSIQVTAGAIRAGCVWVEATTDSTIFDSWDSAKNPAAAIGSEYFYIPSITVPYGDASNTAWPERKNILINSSAPNETGYAGTGTEGTPTYNGWEFSLAAGDTYTCTVRVLALLAADS